MRIKTILLTTGAILFIVALCLVGVYFLGDWEVSVTLKGNDVETLSYGDSYQDAGAAAELSGSLVSGISLPVSIDQSALEEDTLGTFEIRYSAEFLGFYGETVREVRVVDDQAPVITLNFIDDYYTRPIDKYQEEGYTASDNYDGDLTGQVTSKEENGKVYYTVTDSSGNTASAEREIIYDDREAPVITLTGENPIQWEKGEAFQEPGYTALDDCDGDVTAGVLVTETEDGYSYTVTDSYENTTTVTRTVNYVDTKPPVISLLGGTDIWMKAGQSYSEAGFSAVDTADGDVTANVTVEGSVNTYRSGDYPITYSVTDAAGNTAEVQRTVHVEPQPQPDVVNPGSKVVYLTFDDGPGPYTQQLLDVLEAYNVKATFFVTAAYPDYQYLIGRAYAAGHSIGIHTYTHDYNIVYASEEAYFEDLQKMQKVVEDQTGSATTLIRFPGGSSNTVSNITPGLMTELTQAVEDQGYQYFDWNVSSGDAGETTDTETVADNVISGIQCHDVSIVLQHDIKSFSVEAVEKILAWGIENGYTFLPLTSTSPTAHHHINN